MAGHLFLFDVSIGFALHLQRHCILASASVKAAAHRFAATALTDASAADPAPLPNDRADCMHYFSSFGVRITSSDAISFIPNSFRISSGRIMRAISRGVWPPRLSLGALLM